MIQKLAIPIKQKAQIRHKYLHGGKDFRNLSLDYTYLVRNIHFFGEIAVGKKGSLSSVHGILAGLNKKVDLALHLRLLSKRYNSFHSANFGETGQANNESGMYIGCELRPQKRWKISGYVDLWYHPWVRTNSDRPSRGHEEFVRLEYTVKRKFEIYIQYKNELKEKNGLDLKRKTNVLIQNNLKRLRLHLKYKLSRNIELRSRLEVSLYNNIENAASRGFMIYQDVLFKPLEFPLSFTMRFALFDTDSYDSRIYAYENDLIGQFSIPPYAYRGLRQYFNFKYRGIQNVICEIRFAQSLYTNRTNLSSGLTEIDGNTKSEIKIQVKYTF
jgi:hypothetical protein